MKVIHSFDEIEPGMAWTIGMFDGVHLGHQALLKRLRAASAKSAVLTFAEHPLVLLSPRDAPRLITQLPEKLVLLEAAGVDVVLVAPFTRELAAMPFDELLGKLVPSHLVLGVGAAFGKRREGTAERVRAWGQSRGVSVEYVEKTVVAGEPVSSSRIRATLALAESLLGRKFHV